MKLRQLIRRMAETYSRDWYAAEMVCIVKRFPYELIPRIRELIRHEKNKMI